LPIIGRPEQKIDITQSPLRVTGIWHCWSWHLVTAALTLSYCLLTNEYIAKFHNGQDSRSQTGKIGSIFYGTKWHCGCGFVTLSTSVTVCAHRICYFLGELEGTATLPITLLNFGIRR